MTNIPRRKIYETMLEFEDVMIEMQILLLSPENFDKYLEKFNSSAIKELARTFLEIKGLLLMFLENKKYENDEDYEKEFKSLIENEMKTFEELEKNPNIHKGFLETCEKIKKFLKENSRIDNFGQAESLYKDLDSFNGEIPHILTIRRDHMR